MPPATMSVPPMKTAAEGSLLEDEPREHLGNYEEEDDI